MQIRLSLFERILHRLHLLPTPFMDAFGSMIFGRVLTIAARRGVFEAVADGPRSVQEIAEWTRLHPRGVTLMAEAFVVGGYLCHEGDGYRISVEGRKWLVRGSPHFVGNLIRYFETLYDRWSAFEYALEHGVPRRAYFEHFTDEDWEIYVYGMADLARLLQPHVLRRIFVERMEGSLLDLGGSHGLYAVELCRRYPKLHAVVMDFASALQVTEQVVRQEGMSERIELRAGDFLRERLPSGQECVLMFNVVHGLTDEQNVRVIASVHEALNDGGRLYILDQVKGTNRRSSLAAFMPLMVGLNLLNEIGGTVYDCRDVERWCSGFRTVKQHRLLLPGVVLVEAVK